MKKITFILTGIFLTAACLHAQPPALFNYQGTVRNSVGSALVNKTITLRLSVREGTAGQVLYSETRMVTTNAFGLFSVQIGSPGTISTTGSIPAVNWQNGNKYMQVEVDEKGGTAFREIGTTRLTSVPYSLYAAGSADMTLPFSKSQSETQPLFSITNTGNATASRAIEGTTLSSAANTSAVIGLVAASAPGNFSAGVRGTNAGTGSNGIGVYGSQNGSGWGVFGTTPSGIGVHGYSDNGIGVAGYSNQNGRAAEFAIQNAANPNTVLTAITNGTGSSGSFINTQLQNNAPTISSLSNGAGDGIRSAMTGTGKAGVFTINNDANVSNALEVSTAGLGRAGSFAISNPANDSDALYVSANGTAAGWALHAISSGQQGAGLFEYTNSGTSSALKVLTAGSGFAADIISNHPVPMALRTQGALRFTGIGEASNRVLVTDPAGNASWNTLASAGGVSGTGTLNYVPKWTPNGTFIGNSQLFDDGTNIGVGTASPAYKMDISTLAPDDGLQIRSAGSGNIRMHMQNGSAGKTFSMVVGGTGSAFGTGNFAITDINAADAARLLINGATGNTEIGRSLLVKAHLQADSNVVLNTGSTTTLINGATTINNTLAANGQVTVTANLSGLDNNINAYPLRVQGSNQGVAIAVNGSRDNTKNFITFWDVNGIQGRIEGQTVPELNNDPQFIFDNVYLSVQDGLALADLIAASSSSTGCVGLGACVTAPVPSLIIAATAKLAAQLAQHSAYIAFKHTGIGVTYQSGAGDYAEWLPKANGSEKFFPGDIVGIRGGRIVKSVVGVEKLMVVSSIPIVLGNMPVEGEEKNYEKIAFMGQVPVKVKGRVMPGDYILAKTDLPGWGMAVHPDKLTITDLNLIVGIAWAGSESDGVSYVKTAVGINNNDIARLAVAQDKKIDKLQDDLAALKSLVAANNEQLKSLVPGYKAIMPENTVTQTEAIKPGEDKKTSEALNSFSGDERQIWFNEPRLEYLVKGIELAEQQLESTGFDTENNPFFRKYKSDPAYKEQVLQQITQKLRAEINRLKLIK